MESICVQMWLFVNLIVLPYDVNFSINSVHRYMATERFSQSKLRQALAVTSKLKDRLEPFIKEVTTNNIQWTFFICSELYQYLSNSDSQVMLRFNSLAALKLLLNTCEFPIVLITEVYFLPLISKIASYQLHLPDKSRGLDYFSSSAELRPEIMKKIGYNYIRLACEIISIYAVVKPYKVFKSKEIPEPSEFTVTLESMIHQKWVQYDHLAFFPDNPLEMRSLFLQKLETFSKDTYNYQNFININLDNIIRKDLYPVGLDIRRILEFYEPFACQFVFQSLRQMSHEKEVVTLINVLKMLTQFIKWGNIQAYYLIETEQLMRQYFERILDEHQNSHSSDRCSVIFQELDGYISGKNQFYRELLCALQVWTVCIAKDLVNPNKDSKTTLLYKKFKLEKGKIQFPYVGNLKKIRNQNSANLEKFKFMNQTFLKANKKTSYKQTFVRRQSTDLQRLMSIGNQNMKQLLKEARSAKNRLNNSREREILEDSSDAQGNTSRDKLIQSSSLGRSDNKMSTFAENYFRQKKRKGRVERNHVDLNTFNLNLTSTNNSVQTVQTDQDEHQNSETFIVDNSNEEPHVKRLKKLNRLKTVPSMDQIPKSQTDLDSIIEPFDMETDYSDELEEGLTAKQVKLTQKFQHMHVHNNKKPCPNRQSKSTIMQFFDENDWSYSTISSGNGSPKRQSIEPQIVILDPQNKKLYSQQNTFSRSQFGKENHELNHRNSLNNIQSSFDKYSKLEQKVVCLQAERNFLKCELEQKNKEIFFLKKNTKRCSLESWSNFLLSDSQINIGETKGPNQPISTDSVWNKENSEKKRAVVHKYGKQMEQLSQLSPKKLLKKKDLLLKNDRIEVGYIIETNKNSAEFTIFITPLKDLNNLRYTITHDCSFRVKEEPGIVRQISKKQQKKINFTLTVPKVPYNLPHLKLKYEMEGSKTEHTIVLPLSFNKFVQLQSHRQQYVNPIILRTDFELLNKKLFKCTSQLHEHFSGLTYLNTSALEEELVGSFIFQGKNVNITIVIRKQEQVRIQCELDEDARRLTESVQFLMTTITDIIRR